LTESILLLGLGLLVLIHGIVLLGWPHRVQKLTLRMYERHGWLERLTPYASMTRTRSAIWVYRVAGAAFILEAVLILYVVTVSR